MVKDGITPIVNEERNLPAFKQEEDSYHAQVDRLTFAYEAVRGESPAATTPLGTTQIAVAQGTSVFAFKKENLALMWQEMFNDLVLPQLMKDLSPEHIMRFVGNVQELNTLDEAAAEIYANDYALEQILAGKSLKKEDIDATKQKAIDTYRKQGVNRFIKIKKAFYDDASFEFDFLVTDEQEDPGRYATNLATVIQTISSTGGMDDPRVKLLVNKFAETLGISPAELEIAEQEAQQKAQQQEMANSQYIVKPLPANSPNQNVKAIQQPGNQAAMGTRPGQATPTRAQ